MQYFVLFFAILILDQVSKEMIHLNMSLGESNAVLDDIFHITYIRNTGAAFSILNQHTVFLGVFAGIMVVTILVFVFLKRKKVHFMMLTVLIMIAAGGTGNDCKANSIKTRIVTNCFFNFSTFLHRLQS